MSQTIIEALLEQRIGLSATAIGSETIAKAIRLRMQRCQLPGVDAYLSYLQEMESEWDELIEAVVVPETWFFRNIESFTFLKTYIRAHWLPTHQNRILRVLSIPCSTGEEPYSITMTLLDAGLSREGFHIEAVDISNRALEKAIRGLYGRESFRGKNDFSFRDRYFSQAAAGYQIHASLQTSNHFLRGNLLDTELLQREDPYDIIFCRNLLIYLSAKARKQAIRCVDRLLSQQGVLFVGHAERPFFNDFGFSWIRQTGVFACYRQNEWEEEVRNTGLPLLVGKQESEITPPPHRPALVEQTQPKAPLLPVPSLALKEASEEASQPRSAPKSRSKNYTRRAGKFRFTYVFERRKHRKNDSPATISAERRHKSGEAVELLNQARELADQGQLEQALSFCEQVLKKNPIHIQGHFLMGMIYLAMGSNKESEEALNKAVYLDPNHQEALNYLAVIAELQEEHKKAAYLRQRIRRIQDKESNNA